MTQDMFSGQFLRFLPGHYIDCIPAEWFNPVVRGKIWLQLPIVFPPQENVRSLFGLNCWTAILVSFPLAFIGSWISFTVTFIMVLPSCIQNQYTFCDRSREGRTMIDPVPEEIVETQVSAAPTTTSFPTPWHWLRIRMSKSAEDYQLADCSRHSHVRQSSGLRVLKIGTLKW